MTRDEHREKCFDAMEAAYWRAFDKSDKVRDYLAAAFDSLHGLAHVNSVEATELPDYVEAMFQEVWRAMSAAGDLTNLPEQKP